jgi:hypothetical protein
MVTLAVCITLVKNSDLPVSADTQVKHPVDVEMSISVYKGMTNKPFLKNST